VVSGVVSTFVVDEEGIVASAACGLVEEEEVGISRELKKDGFSASEM